MTGNWCFRFLLPSALAMLCMVCIGCGGDTGPELSFVSGKVTLDGKPLAKVSLQFTPEQETGSPSYGATNADGEYELLFSTNRSGAMPGKHRVEITAVEPEVDQEGKLIDSASIVKIPTKYSVPGTLSADVHSGSNTIDFALESK